MSTAQLQYFLTLSRFIHRRYSVTFLAKDAVSGFNILSVMSRS